MPRPSTGALSTWTCRTCGEQGHTARTCAQRLPRGRDGFIPVLENASAVGLSPSFIQVCQTDPDPAALVLAAAATLERAAALLRVRPVFAGDDLLTTTERNRVALETLARCARQCATTLEGAA